MAATSLRPATGGRVSLELVSAAPVAYHASLYVPDAEWHGEACLDAAGTVTLSGVDEAPAWLLDYLRAFLRSEFRSRQTADAAPWPDRITRWRGP